MGGIRFFVFWVLGALLFAAPSSYAQTAKTLQKFDRLFQIKLREGEVPGGAYAIIRDGEILQLNVFGHKSVRSSDAIDPDTAFRLASVSKTVAATLTAKLVEEGALGWEDRIKPYAPALRLKSRAYLDKLTVRHVLSHTSGLVPNAYDNILEAGRPLDDILPRFNKVRTLCAPGNCYGYQNIIFSLVEPVLEDKTGQSYEALVMEKLFTPLEMKNASVGYEAFVDEGNKALPHQRTRKGIKPVKVKENYYRIAPAAGVNASIRDLAKWLIAHTGHRPEVVSDLVLATLTQKQIRTKRQLGKKLWRPHLTDAHYGLGWRLFAFHDEDIVAHGGAVAGFRSMVAYSPDRDTGLAILMNANSSIIDELTISFWEGVTDTPRPYRGTGLASR